MNMGASALCPMMGSAGAPFSLRPFLYALFLCALFVRYEAFLLALARCAGSLGVIGWIKVPFSLSKAKSLGYYFSMSDFYRNFVT